MKVPKKITTSLNYFTSIWYDGIHSRMTT